MYNLLVECVTRLSFGAFGLFGIASVMPNAMMSDDPSSKSNGGVGIAISGSALMTLGGFTGLIRPTFIPIKIPIAISGLGFGCQILGFFIVCSRRKK